MFELILARGTTILEDWHRTSWWFLLDSSFVLHPFRGIDRGHTVAVLAAPLKDGSDVLGERDFSRFDAEVRRREKMGLMIGDTPLRNVPRKSLEK
jgi:hypothetical protein